MPTMPALSSESTQTSGHHQGTGIDLTCLDWSEAKCLYQTDSVQVSRVALTSNWTEVGQSIPTLSPSKTPYVAVKQFPGRCADVCAKEYKILKACNHPSIVTAFGMSHEPERPFYVMEAGERSLYQLLHGIEAPTFPTNPTGDESGGYTISHCLWWMQQLSDALAYLHDQKNIIHRDVKSANILLFDGGYFCKLCDFDCSRYLSNNNMTPEVGTQLWMAPEVAKARLMPCEKREYTATSDCYSLGVVMCEAIFRLTPGALLHSDCGEGNDEALQVHVDWFVSDGRHKRLNLATSVFPYGEHKTQLDVVKKILSRLLIEDPETRYSASMVFSMLESLHAKLPLLHGLVPQQSDAFSASSDRGGPAEASVPVTAGTVSGVSNRSFYVYYDVSFAKSGAALFSCELTKHVEKVLNAIGDRTNTRAASDPNQPFQAKHCFKVLEGVSANVLQVEHAIGDPCRKSAENIQNYCQSNSEHTKWLAKQFEEDNNVQLRELTFSVWNVADTCTCARICPG